MRNCWIINKTFSMETTASKNSLTDTSQQLLHINFKNILDLQIIDGKEKKRYPAQSTYSKLKDNESFKMQAKQQTCLLVNRSKQKVYQTCRQQPKYKQQLIHILKEVTQIKYEDKQNMLSDDFKNKQFAQWTLLVFKKQILEYQKQMTLKQLKAIKKADALQKIIVQQL